LGAQVSFVGCIGNDRFGDEAVEWLQKDGIGISHLRRSDKSPTGIGFILLDDRGIPAMVTALGANAELCEGDIDAALSAMRGAKLLLTQFEIDPARAVYAARAAQRLGMIAMVNPAPAPTGHPVDLRGIDILCPNETEALLMLGRLPGGNENPCTLARQLREQTGVKTVMMTLGERGVALADAVGERLLAPPQVDVVDTSGAGDAFCAAVAVALVRGETQQAAAQWGCQVAALSVTRPGTIPAYPSMKEVEIFIKVNANRSPDPETK
jgi:ribokinase